MDPRHWSKLLVNNPETDNLDLRRRRCLYRAKHRGTKEMDWLLGRYAEVALPSVDADEIAFWEELVQIPDPEFHDWIMGHAEAPDTRIGAVVREIRKFHCM